jgi:hypothetical protein
VTNGKLLTIKSHLLIKMPDISTIDEICRGQNVACLTERTEERSQAVEAIGSISSMGKALLGTDQICVSFPLCAVRS